MSQARELAPASTDPLGTALPFGEPRLPISHAREGWLHAYRSKQGLSLEPSADARRELWSIEPDAGIEIQVPSTADGAPIEALHLVLHLRAPWRGSKAPQRVSLLHDGLPVANWQVSPETAEAKLAVLPKELVPPSGALRFALSCSEGAPAPVEHGDERSWPLRFELSNIRLYPSRAAFLAALQADYESARAYREELFDRGTNPVEDRGQLLDKVEIALEQLRALPSTQPDTFRKLQRLLDDPWVRGRCDQRLVFDDEYFETHGDELFEGAVDRAVREWRKSLEDYQRTVVYLGNRAFLMRGEQSPDAHPNDPAKDELRELVETFDFPREKLQTLKARNDFLNTLEILLQRDRIESVVPDLEIELSSYCNYACVMCGRSWFPFQFDRQNDAQLAKLLPVLPYIRHVTIAGVGENTTSDRLGVFALMLEKFDCDSRIFTNGSFIDRQLEALSRFRKVCVSFDGGTAETFETQRRGAQFERVLRNVALLRSHAPQLAIAFSVVVSRLNLAELPLIARHAVALGVNHIALSPVWHDSPMRLRPSDREPFDQLLAEARAIADPAGVAIQVNFGPEDFEVAADEPLDRARLLAHFQNLEFPSLKIPSMAELERAFSSLEYCHHPDPSIFPERRWPAPPPPAPSMSGAAPVGFRYELDLDVALARTEAAIERAHGELRARDAAELRLPYCLSIWKYTYTHANGKNRLCPQTLIDVGNSGRDGYVPIMNSEKNRHFRRTMFGGELEPLCKTCLDPYRRWGHDEVSAQLRELGLSPHDGTRYSERFA